MSTTYKVMTSIQANANLKKNLNLKNNKPVFSKEFLWGNTGLCK